MQEFCQAKKAKKAANESESSSDRGGVCEWLSEITVTEQTKIPNFAYSLFRTY